MINETTTIGIGVLGLLGWIAKLIIPYFMAKLDQKDEAITILTREFRETINHKQTAMTEALNRLETSSTRHVDAIQAQTEVFKQLIQDNGGRRRYTRSAKHKTIK